MQKTLFLLLLLFCCSFSASAQWKTLSNWGGSIKGRTISANNGVLYAATSNGFYRSTDEGLHWQRFNNLPYQDISSATVTDDGVLFLIAYDGGKYHLLVSHSAGYDWKELPMPTGYWPGEPLRAAGPYVYYTYSSRFRIHQDSVAWTSYTQLASGAGNLRRQGNDLWASASTAFYRSADFGDTWTKITPTGTNLYFQRFDLKDDVIIALKGNSYSDTLAWRSADHGASMQKVNLPEAFSQVYAGRDYFYGVSITGKMFRSADGMTWDYLFPAISTGWAGIVQVGEAVILPHPKGLLRSGDSGLTWQLSNSGLANSSTLAHQAAGNYLLASGQHFSNDAGKTWFAPPYPLPTFEPNMRNQFYQYKGEWYGRKSAELYKSSDLLNWVSVPSRCTDSTSTSLIGFVQFGDTLIAGPHETSSTLSRLYRSVDGGATLELIHKHAEEIRLVAAHKQSLIGWEGPTPSNKYIISFDYGLTWQPFGNGQFDNSTFNIFRSVGGKLYNLRNGTTSPTISCSTDDGLTWKSVSSALTSQISGGAYGIRDYLVQGDRIFAYVNHYLGGDDRMYLSTDHGATWADFSGTIDGTQVDIGNMFLGNGHLCFTNLQNGDLWLRPLNDIDRNQVPGTVFLDANETGIQEPQEPGAPFFAIQSVPNRILTASDQDGKFVMLDASFDDTIRVALPYASMKTVPAFHLTKTKIRRDFAVQWNSNFRDLRVTLNQASVFRSGFATNVLITLTNEGPVTLTGPLSLLFSDQVIPVETTPDSLSLTGNTLNWEYVKLKPLQTIQFEVTFQTKLPPFNDAYIAMLAFAPVANDSTPLNNRDSLNSALLYAFDPNDKQVDRRELTPQQVAQSPELTYKIRFQNTGTAPAFRVRLLDTLSQWVDPATLHVRAASHPYRLLLSGRNIAEFIFDDINLPDSTSDEANSHGFVEYVVRPRKDVPLDSSIYNTAHIFFDFNEAVVTNTVRTLITEVLRTFQLNRPLLLLSPNPAGDVVRMLHTEEMREAQVEIFNAKGQKVRSLRLADPGGDIDLQGLAAGTYYLVCRDHNNLRIGKLIKM